MTLLAESPSGLEQGSSPALPVPRGPLSRIVVRALSGGLGPVPVPWDLPTDIDPLTDDDLQLALYCCYELHYRGFAHVDPEWEWWPPLLAFRRSLETVFEARIREEVGSIDPVEDVRGRPWLRSSRTVMVPHCPDSWRSEGTVAADAGVLHPPVGVPAEGSRPSHLGHSAYRWGSQGRHGGDTGRRVRGRRGGRHALHPLRRHHGRTRARTLPTAPISIGFLGPPWRP